LPEDATFTPKINKMPDNIAV
jgi:hypothetical protein